MLMPERSLSLSNYRFGFNGKEQYGELDNGFYDYGKRTYNSRLGKFLSLDPLMTEFPWWSRSPYHFAGNTPGMAVDLDGKEN
jgi:RHS repeat-associated protein